MIVSTITWTRPKPIDGIYPVNETSDVPSMRPRIGKRGADPELAKLLTEALDDLAGSTCCYWACKGPSRPLPMTTCKKCYAMRRIATVLATIITRA